MSAEFWEAVRSGDCTAVCRLLELDPSLATATEPHEYGFGLPALHLATFAGHRDVADVLLRHEADPKATCHLRYPCPLAIAAEVGRRDIARLLLAGGADPNQEAWLPWTVSWMDQAPLAAARDTGMADVLIEHGADPAPQNETGWSQLHWAAGNWGRPMIDLVLGRGLDINARSDDGYTLLLLATAADSPDAGNVRFLTEHGADVSARMSGAVPSEVDDEVHRDGGTALHLAAYAGSGELVRLLLARGAEVDARDSASETPLHHAARSHPDPEMPAPRLRQASLLLLRAGAEVNARNEDGQTPLHVAAYGCNLPVVEALLSFGARPDILDTRRRGPARLVGRLPDMSDTERAAAGAILRRLVAAEQGEPPQENDTAWDAAREHAQTGLPKQGICFYFSEDRSEILTCVVDRRQRELPENLDAAKRLIAELAKAGNRMLPKARASELIGTEWTAARKQLQGLLGYRVAMRTLGADAMRDGDVWLNEEVSFG